MLDLSHIPNNLRSNVSFFYNTSAALNVDTVNVWHKPRGSTFIYIISIGAGGGGGAGGTFGVGGGGGASGTITTLLIPACLLPDTLYPVVGKGGIGNTSTSTGNGSNGGSSYVSLYMDSVTTKICISNGGGGGQNGAALSSTSAGGIVTTPTAASQPFSSLGVLNITSGQSGSGGNAAAVGVDLTPNTTLVSGGTSGGGAGTSLALRGGNILTDGVFIQQIDGGLPRTKGNDGISYLSPIRFIGGTGGGGSNNTIAGAGGNGGIGSGGGGGGAKSSVGPGQIGPGGNGGDGLIIIYSF